MNLLKYFAQFIGNTNISLYNRPKYDHSMIQTNILLKYFPPWKEKTSISMEIVSFHGGKYLDRIR